MGVENTFPLQHWKCAFKDVYSVNITNIISNPLKTRTKEADRPGWCTLHDSSNSEPPEGLLATHPENRVIILFYCGKLNLTPLGFPFSSSYGFIPGLASETGSELHSPVTDILLFLISIMDIYHDVWMDQKGNAR